MKLGNRVKTTLGTGRVLAFENVIGSGKKSKLELQKCFNESTVRVVVKLDYPENWIFYPEQKNPHFLLNELEVITN